MMVKKMVKDFLNGLMEIIMKVNIKNDLKYGKGFFKWNNGDNFEGEFRFNKYNGIGTLTWY